MVIEEQIERIDGRINKMKDYIDKKTADSGPSNHLRDMPPFSLETDKIDDALCNAQAEFEDVKKTSKGYNFKYASLAEIKDAIHDALRKYKIAIVQLWEPSGDNDIYMATIIRHGGQWIKSGFSFTVSDLLEKPTKQAAEQEIGKRITYYRRYQIQSLLFLYGEDTDGNK